MFTPPITVKLDIERDTQEFLKFLYRQAPEKQKLIVRTYPDLAVAVQQGEDAGREFVTDFVRGLYASQDESIRTLVADMTRQAQTDGHRVLEALGEVMEYSWAENDEGYTIIPTLLPFSPFQQPVFFFSLARFLRTQAQTVASDYGLTAVLAHEVSHFIFFDMLDEVPKEISAKYDRAIVHFAKEILAPVVMNDSRINTILHLKDYGGNPFLRHVMIRDNGKDQNIVDFFRTEYKHASTSSAGFKSFVSFLLDTLLAIQPSIQERLAMWDAHGSALISDTKLNAQYCEPIDIKR